MPTERCSIGISEANRAFRMAKEGHEGSTYIFKHMGREGLQLRVQQEHRRLGRSLQGLQYHHWVFVS